MKKQYFADKRDYLKYSILQHLLAQEISVTVCWMMTPDDHTGQGARKRYLKEPKRWRSFDPDVFDFLKAQVDGGCADIKSVERKGPISSCRFYWECFQSDCVIRKRYLDVCLYMASGTHLVFFDPDIGPEPEKPKDKDMDKYVLWNELEHAGSRGGKLALAGKTRHFQTETLSLVDRVRSGENELTWIFRGAVSNTPPFVAARPGSSRAKTRNRWRPSRPRSQGGLPPVLGGRLPSYSNSFVSHLAKLWQRLLLVSRSRARIASPIRLGSSLAASQA